MNRLNLIELNKKENYLLVHFKAEKSTHTITTVSQKSAIGSIASGNMALNAHCSKVKMRELNGNFKSETLAIKDKIASKYTVLNYMINSKLFLLIGFLITFGFNQKINGQSQVAIVLNEYSASNTTGPADNFGVLSDWVELYNPQPSQVSLSGYYLSNDRFNLFKWKFPSGFTLASGEIKVIWLSGRNVNVSGGLHTNFTLDQCKNQWLILSTSAGVVRDSVFVQKTKAGHTRARVDVANTGVGAWKLYTTNSHLAANPTINNYFDYVPKPTLFPVSYNATVTPLDTAAKTNSGMFHEDGQQIYKVKINGYDYDTLQFPCYNVYYTTDGNYPVPGTPYTTRYIGGPQPTGQYITIGTTSMIRAITVPAPGNSVIACPTGYLDSFCETNTYFIDTDHQTFDKNFGVVSIAMDRADTAWFNSQGSPANTLVHVEYYDTKKQFSEGYATIARPSNETWFTKQRGFYISIDDRYGFGCNFEGNIFNVEDLGTSARKSFPTLHLKSGDYESCSGYTGYPSDATDGTGLREVFYQTLAAKNKLNVSPMHVKPVVTFVNGKYWGVYNLTEVVDKYYEGFYNGQPEEALDVATFHGGDASVSYADGSVSTYSNNFKTTVYDNAVKFPLNASGPGTNYDKVMAALDKKSFMDYVILTSYAMNPDIWNYNIAMAKGSSSSKAGNKWHYYLWNMPAIFNFTNYASVYTNTLNYTSCATSPCAIASVPGYVVSPKAHNGHGAIFARLMDGTIGNNPFKLEYKNRYQDLLNGPLKCENIIKHWKLIDTIYGKEMRCHEDPGCTAGPGKFASKMGNWDTAMNVFKRKLQCRCFEMESSFKKSGCYGLTGPFQVVVNVTPEGAGTVKLNSINLDSYPWVGHYFQTQMSFKAAPTNTNYVFHHWEFKKHTPTRPVSLDSVAVQSWSFDDEVLAVFTDVTSPLTSGSNIPNAFSPNGDGNNDWFKPLGSAAYVTDYQLTIWNRWGQEVFRSTDPTGAGWDGNYNGQQALTGVYAYVITYKNIYGESKIVKDNLTLTR
ncbi:MAG: gliding motility-associated C-terminal domain-containing protein [Bacteroidia bacterium]|nr:gliding motility-associated C-terminal domain-containing protein [Bacteroidia bacterium]